MAHATGTSLRTDPNEHLSIEEVEAREKDRRARHRSYDRIAAVLYPVATMVGIIVLWEVVVRAFDIPSFLAPPPSLVEDEFTNVWKTIQDDLQARKRTFEEEGTTEEKAKEEYRGIANRRVRLGLVIAEIGERNGIKVSDEELSRAVMDRARQIGRASCRERVYHPV